MPVTILYLITDLAVGGAPNALLRLLQGLNRERYQPFVGCLFNGDSSVAAEIRALGIPVFDMRMNSKTDIGAMVRLSQLIRNISPRILHCSLFHANLPGRLIGRFVGVPVIINSERSSGIEKEWRYRVNRLTIDLVDCVIAVSEHVRDFCVDHIGLSPDKVQVIYNGVTLPDDNQPTSREVKRYLNIADDIPLIGAVCRIEPVKGISFLIQAITQLPGVEAIIIGDGSERESLEAKASKLGVGERIHWLGFRNDVQELIPAFDVFVQPSLYEGLSNSILEAMAAYLPVVATSAGGTPELVVDQETGLLVPPENVQALAEAIRGLLDDENRRQHYGQAGRERVEAMFTAEKMVRQTEDLYSLLLETT